MKQTKPNKFHFADVNFKKNKQYKSSYPTILQSFRRVIIF